MSINQSDAPRRRKPKVARDRITLSKGKLFIFTRHESVKPIWQCEIRLPDQPHIIRSTGTADQEQATEIAHGWFQEAKSAVAQGREIQVQTTCPAPNFWSAQAALVLQLHMY